jgi:hypothetical protein
VTQSHGSKAELSQDSQTADKSKTVERRRRKVRRLKPARKRGQDRPTAERQNRENPVAQSHGSKITKLFFVIMIARLPKSDFFTGMTAWSSLCVLTRAESNGIVVIIPAHEQTFQPASRRTTGIADFHGTQFAHFSFPLFTALHRRILFRPTAD